MTSPAILDRAAVAARQDPAIGPDTVTTYLARTRRRVAAELDLRPWDLPLPDGYVGDQPYWYEPTIERWEAARPGRGVGGGRPRRAG